MLWMLFAVQSASQLTPPLPEGWPDVRAVFSADDMPRYVQQAGISRAVYTRTVVRPDGSIQGCTAEISSGDVALDKYTCGLILKRAKFVPAKWMDGSAAYGVVKVPVRWVIAVRDIPPSDEEVLRSTLPDFKMTVDQLPKPSRSIAGVSLEIAADESGKVVECGEPPRFNPRDKKPRFPELVPVACAQVVKTYRASPPLDEQGKPIRSVQMVSVHLEKKRN